MKRITRKNPFLIFLVIFGLLFFLHILGFLRPLENFFINTVKPLNSRLYNWGILLNNSYQDKESQENLQIKIEKLNKEMASLIVANSKQKELAEENIKLRKQLNFLDVNNFKAVTAAVIARESLDEGVEGAQDLIISKGADDGIMLGQGVISEEGVIVGKVIEVKETSAKICLTTSPECKLAATIQNQARTQGITDGDMGLTIKMNYIPQFEKIFIGDTVVTSGLGGKIPRGLVIGKIVEIRNESNEVWQDATIETLVNLNNLSVVMVVIS